MGKLEQQKFQCGGEREMRLGNGRFAQRMKAIRAGKLAPATIGHNSGDIETLGERNATILANRNQKRPYFSHFETEFEGEDEGTPPLAGEAAILTNNGWMALKPRERPALPDAGDPFKEYRKALRLGITTEQELIRNGVVTPTAIDENTRRRQIVKGVMVHHYKWWNEFDRKSKEYDDLFKNKQGEDSRKDPAWHKKYGSKHDHSQCNCESCVEHRKLLRRKKVGK